MNSEYRNYMILLVLAVGSWILADLFEAKSQKKFVKVDHSPDYFSTDYYKKEMNEQGELKNELVADKMVHYSDDGTTHLENPLMILYNSKSPPWVIRAKKGILAADKDHLQLQGKVFISRKGTRRRKPIKINTSDLTVKLSISHAQTKKWAEIISAANRTEGVGLDAIFAEPIKLKFLSRVKGRYEVN